MFSINKQCTLSVISAIDLSLNPEYRSINLTISVIHENDRDLSDQAVVYVVVYDINQYAPVFSTSTFSTTINGAYAMLSV